MIRRKSVRLAAACAVSAVLIAACSSDGKSTSNTTGSTSAPTESGAPGTTGVSETTGAPDTTEAAATGWTVDTSDCIDEDAANAPIEGTIKIGSVMPLTGGVAAAAFAPVKDGFTAYLDYANSKGLLGDVKIEYDVQDDQYSKDQTPGAVSKLIEGGVNIVSGIIGSADNAAVRDTLNDNCIPQLNALTGLPAWGDVANYPWTTGGLVPYDVESKVYAAQLKELYPNGAKVAMFYVNSEFGTAYADAFKELAGEYGLEIVDEETVEAEDNAPPTSQITNIVAKKPDVVMAVPLGAGCISFLTELAAAKAQNADWKPATFITNTCASSLILGAAGPAADGLYTSGNIVDVTNPANATIPAVKEYIDYMTSVNHGDIVATAAAGWTIGEVTVAILMQAQKSPDGLTRASVINAARNFTYTPTLARPGVVDKMDGEADAFLAQSLQVLQYNATTATFTDIGKLITQFES